MLSLEKIATFLAVATHGSFAKTALKLGITTAAVSRQVSSLEKELNAVLLYRTTKSVKLTEIGEKYAEHCKKVLKMLEDGSLLLSEWKGEASGELRILSTPHLGKLWILPHLRKFTERFPKIRLQMEFAERYPAMEEEDLDIVYGMTVDGPPSAIQKQLGTTRYLLCASPSYLKMTGTPKTISDLSHHRFLTHLSRRPNDLIKFKSGDVHFLPSLYLNDIDALVKCAVEGLGIIWVHDYTVLEELRLKKLVVVMPNESSEAKPIYLWYRPERYVSPKVRAFVDFFGKPGS